MVEPKEIEGFTEWGRRIKVRPVHICNKEKDSAGTP